MTLVVDGRAIAEDLYSGLATRRAGKARPPRLGILVTGHDPVIESFVVIKSKSAARLAVEIVRFDLPETANTEDAINAIRELSEKTDAVIVQLPLSKNIDVNAALSSIPDDKDVDAISTATGSHLLEAPVALAIVEILNRSGVELQGKHTVVVGAGRLVGSPSAQLLKKRGADVSIVTLGDGSLDDLKTADIVVCGAGNPGLIKPEHLKDGVVLIDAGASEQGGKIIGDADPACADKASVFSPVPGGVGPVSVAMIFKNLFDLMDMPA
jgi:methylenetetrahydrofolate dehydrogenase (NADP+)/methenyltetrahydrofolate cyclohydrolase